MSKNINGVRKMIVKKAVKEHAENVDGSLQPGTPEYADLIHNIESQVQNVLEEEGHIEF